MKNRSCGGEKAQSGFRARMLRVCSAGAVTLLWTLLSHPSAAVVIAGSIDVSLATGLVVSGDYAYLSSETDDFVIIDVSDPASPHEVAGIDFDEIGESIAVSGTLAIVGTRSGLRTIDVSNPGEPKPLGEFSAPYLHRSRSVRIEGERALLGHGDTLHIIDISTPEEPSEVAFLQLDAPGAEISDIEVRDGLAYVAIASFLKVIDVSTPSEPKEVESVASGRLLDLEFYGAQLLGMTNSGFLPFDLTTPSELVVPEIVPIATPGPFAVSGYQAYVGPNDGLVIFDVSDPNTPIQQGTFGAILGGGDPQIQGGYAYQASVGRLVISRVGSFETPSALDGPSIPESWELATAGDLAFVPIGGGEDRVAIFKLSDRAQIEEIGSFPASTSIEGDIEPFDTGCNSGFVVVADNHNGLRVVGVHDPTSPVPVAALPPERGVTIAVSIYGHYAYTAEAYGGMRIVDLFDARAPEEKAALDLGMEVWDVEVQGAFAFAAGSGGLRVVDVSNPTAPVVVGRTEFPKAAHDIEISGDYLYAAESGSLDRDLAGLRVFDISNPREPVLVHTVSRVFGGYLFLAQSVEVVDDRAYVAAQNTLLVFDVRDPRAPVESGGHLGLSHSVAISGDLVVSVGTSLQLVGLGSEYFRYEPKVEVEEDFNALPTQVSYQEADGLVRVRTAAGGVVASGSIRSGSSAIVDKGFFGRRRHEWRLVTSLFQGAYEFLNLRIPGHTLGGEDRGGTLSTFFSTPRNLRNSPVRVRMRSSVGDGCADVSLVVRGRERTEVTYRRRLAPWHQDLDFRQEDFFSAESPPPGLAGVDALELSVRAMGSESVNSVLVEIDSISVPEPGSEIGGRLALLLVALLSCFRGARRQRHTAEGLSLSPSSSASSSLRIGTAPGGSALRVSKRIRRGRSAPPG